MPMLTHFDVPYLDGCSILKGTCEKGVLPLHRDWMNLYEGKSQVVLRPQTPQQVSQVLSRTSLSCPTSSWPVRSVDFCAQCLLLWAHHSMVGRSRNKPQFHTLSEECNFVISISLDTET